MFLLDWIIVQLQRVVYILHRTNAWQDLRIFLAVFILPQGITRMKHTPVLQQSKIR